MRRRLERSAAALGRARAWLRAAAEPDGGAGRAGGRESPGPAGLVLTSPAAVAWLCGGVSPLVDRTARIDLVWAVVTTDRAALITTNVEASRIRAEYDPAAHGFADLAEVPWYQAAWYQPGGEGPAEGAGGRGRGSGPAGRDGGGQPPARNGRGFAGLAEELAGAPVARLASDGHPQFGIDASDDLIALRLALSPAEAADLAELGADAAAALQSALAEWRPGERDLDIQARCAAALEAAGADSPVLIVGGDERLMRFRHPMAAGAPVRRLAMAVVVARRHGLHVAASRFACAGPLAEDYLASRDRVLAIDHAVLTATRPGNTYGDALAALAAGYAAAGAPGGWAGHYQGGPIGFAQREFEIAPVQAGSRWFSQPIEAGHAIAWNPSLPGGAKVEDTYLVTADGALDPVTRAPGWPEETIDGRLPPRPAVLEVGP